MGNAVHMAEGYSRVTNKPGVCIAQNGPGITNFVTGVAAAFWAHSPVVVITPETGSLGQGLGGFQEMNQLPTFSEITKYQAHVCSPKRMAEFTNRCFHYAMMERGPVQLNIPRDHFYGDVTAKIPAPMAIERSAGGPEAIAQAEKKNQVDFYNNRFQGTNLYNPSFAELSKTMGAEGIKVTKPEEVGAALKTLIASGKPGVLEIMVSKTLADPFRRDALSKPVRHLEKYKSFV